ncbi:MAG: hypothetical protein PWP15_615 [Methanothermococcus sp.]|jgi:hypothetical protein|nr:hypothetical protein [Methanothermococcus sp.]
MEYNNICIVILYIKYYINQNNYYENYKLFVNLLIIKLNF